MNKPQISLSTAVGLLASIDQCGAQIRIEETPAGPEMRVSDLGKLPANLWAALMEASGHTVAELRRLINAREAMEQPNGGAANEQKQQSFQALAATVAR